MAASFNRLGFIFLRHSRRIPCRRKQCIGLPPQRLLNSSPNYRARTRDDDDDDADSRKVAPEPYSFNYDSLDPETRHHYDLLSPEEKTKFQSEEKAAYEHLTSGPLESELQGLVSQAVYDIQQDIPQREPRPRITPGLMAMGEVDEQGTGEDDEFDGDDISSIAHGELEQHREIREYARIAAWEMPMLSSMLPFSNDVIPATPAICKETLTLGIAFM